MDVLQWTKQSTEEKKKEIGTQQVDIWAGSLNGYGVAEGAETRVQEEFCPEMTEQKAATKIKRKTSSQCTCSPQLSKIYLLESTY